MSLRQLSKLEAKERKDKQESLTTFFKRLYTYQIDFSQQKPMLVIHKKDDQNLSFLTEVVELLIIHTFTPIILYAGGDVEAKLSKVLGNFRWIGNNKVQSNKNPHYYKKLRDLSYIKFFMGGFTNDPIAINCYGSEVVTEINKLLLSITGPLENPNKIDLAIIMIANQSNITRVEKAVEIIAGTCLFRAFYVIRIVNNIESNPFLKKKHPKKIPTVAGDNDFILSSTFKLFL